MPNNTVPKITATIFDSSCVSFGSFSSVVARLIESSRSLFHLGVQEDGGQCQILGVQGLDCREGTEEKCQGGLIARLLV